MCQHREELKQLNVAVLLISFGPQENAKDWLEEICPSFQLLLDPERTAYHAYKLKHSWLSSWNLKTLMYYARALFGGREWLGIVGDSAQLGGDFIIAQDRSLLLEYRSKEATDRPDVSELLKVLREQPK